MARGGGGSRWNPQSQSWEEWQEDERPPVQQPAPQPPAHLPWPPQQPPPVGYGNPAGPGSGERKWKVPVLVAVGAALVGVGVMAGWLVDTDRKAPAAPPGASGTPSPGPSDEAPVPSPSASASPSPDAPTTSPAPAPYTVVHSEDGFSVAVPEGWQRSHDESGAGSFYRPPGDRRSLLQVFRVTENAGVGACELLRESSEHLRGNGSTGYVEVSRAPVPGASCELVYEYDSVEAGGRRRGVERITVAADGSRWALLAAGPAAEWATTQEILAAALREFRPDA
ncbi:hypothetical protein KPP03845_104615 [Streptomyces xanthophaeus]|uniref:hypothetical protein n=1 Tax=Streptomyces xanthophaeus TaxID=67385 RepID=UPI00233ECB38|nr:hypothetical protein [Streptomyces xanthophaeus]WCD88210.1 hypothetical protein KPP03845_104615 [Streptomyces xanthophaeus]